MTNDVGGLLDRRKAEVGLEVDDVLDVVTAARIEELHAAVLQLEGEGRFGRLRSSRAQEVADAHDAEQAFLNEHGFATYNDYRLRIRRTVTGAPGPSRSTGAPAPNAPCDAPTATEQSDEGGTAPEASPLSVEGPVLGADELAAAVDEGAPRGRAHPASSAVPLQTEPWIAAVRREFDSYVIAQSELAEARAALARDEASRRAADIVAQATGCFEESQAFLAEVTALTERIVAPFDSLLVLMAERRAPVDATVSAL
jgi:hypothetical protein